MPQQPDPYLSALDDVQGSHPASDPFLSALDDAQAGVRPPPIPLMPSHVPSAPGEAPSLVARAIPMGLRIVPTVAGGIIGSAFPGAGTLLGAGAGAGLGEYAAERYEQLTGQRDAVNPTQVALQTALGMIPAGRALGATARQIAGYRAAQGALMGGGATAATQYTETGEWPSARQVATGAVLGGLMGGGLGRIEGRIRGARSAPDVLPPAERPALPPGARFVAGPNGQVAMAGSDIPMTAAPDGSYVRSVPAEYAQREVRGLLPAGPRFVASDAGQVVPVEQADALLRALDDVQGPRPAGEPSAVRAVPAAVIAREVDPTQPTSQAIRVRQFSSDPTAVDTPLLSDAQTTMLRRMQADLETFTPQRGRLIRDPSDPASALYAHGARGSYVGEDIRVISGQHVGNDRIAAAIDDLLAGKPPTNKLHIAALDASQGYLEQRTGYRGPQVPEAVVQTPRPAGGGGTPGSAMDDFAAFSSMFDDEAPAVVSGLREPGQEGFIASRLVAHVAGGAGGALAGAATGETPQERVENALLFGLAGAAVPAFLPRRRGSLIAHRPGSQQAPVTTSGRAPAVSAAGRTGAPIPDPMAGVEVFLGKFRNPLVREGVRERLIANAGYAGQRRGVIGAKDLGRFANEVRVNVEKTLPKGTALNAEQVTAYARALAETQRRVNELAAKVASAAATDADVIALHAAKADAEVVATSLMGARAEAGRALAAFNLYQSVLETGDVTLIRDVLRAPGMRRDAERLAQELARLPDDALVRYQWLRRQTSSTLLDKARSVYYANILSGIKTHERNLVGNIANLSTELVVHPVAAGVDAARSAVTGAPRTVRFDELPSKAAGAIAGVERGFRDAFFTLRHGVSPDRLTRTVGAATTGTKFDLPRVEFAGGAGNPFNWPGRALDAGDTLFRSIARNMELYGMAHTQATREGLTGARFLDRVAALRAGVTPEGQAIREAAETFATRSVFQEQPGRMVSGYQHIVREVPALSLLTPFVKTPANILRQGIEFSPAGVLMKAARQGGRAGAQAQARVVLGTAAAGYLFWLASSHRLSGNGPRNATDRNALLESGWRPNSVRLGDRWVSYQLFQPLSVQMAAVANAVEAWREAGADATVGPDVAAKTFAKFLGSFLDQSFLSGLFDFVDALNNPEQAAERWAGRTLSSAIPFTAAVRTAQQAMDPVVRQPRGVQETVQAGLPVLSESVPPRIGRFGQVVTREGGPVRRATDPFNVASITEDPIARELDRLGVRLSLPSPTTAVPGGVSRAQETEIRQRRGQAVRAALERVLANPRYQRMSDEQRTQTLERMIDRARQLESRTIRREAVRQQVAQRETFTHPQYGRVRIVGAMPNGSIRVVRELPDGSTGGRHFLVRSGDLQRVSD